MSRGLRIQQCRIREAMRRVNRAAVLLQALELRTIHRRRYQVYGPLALWHIDGNHKLVRYETPSNCGSVVPVVLFIGNTYTL